MGRPASTRAPLDPASSEQHLPYPTFRCSQRQEASCRHLLRQITKVTEHYLACGWVSYCPDLFR